MLYGGARSGKTFITVRNMIIRALKCESRHAILRLHFNDVKTSILMDTFPKVMKLCFPQVPYHVNKQDWFVLFENGSEIWFAGVADKERTEKILGKEYSTVYMNECSQISFETVEQVTTRLAQKTPLRNKAFYDCNPRSKKHWTYKWFIEKRNPKDNSLLPNPHLYASMLLNPKDNQKNLPPDYIQNMLGSLTQKQRLRFEHGQFVDDNDNALWNMDLISRAQNLPPFDTHTTVVAVDPAVTNNENSDLTGIVVIETDGKNANVLGDYSLKASPNDWAKRVIEVYEKHQASYIVAEVNQGGDLVENILKSKNNNLMVKKVRASKGKFARAEPVVALYEQGRVSHAKCYDSRTGRSRLNHLEEEMMEYVPFMSKKSPDRLDALVWALSQAIILVKNSRIFVL